LIEAVTCHGDRVPRQTAPRQSGRVALAMPPHDDDLVGHLGHAAADAPVDRPRTRRGVGHLAHDHDLAPRPDLRQEVERRVDRLHGRLEIVAEQVRPALQSNGLEPFGGWFDALQGRGDGLERAPLGPADCHRGECRTDERLPQEPDPDLPGRAFRVEEEAGPARPVEPYIAGPDVVGLVEAECDDPRAGASPHPHHIVIIAVEHSQVRGA
jgi:hypothetical protein